MSAAPTTGGWFPVQRDDLAKIASDLAPSERATTAVVVFLALVGMANRRNASEVQASVGEVARLANVSYATTFRRLVDLETLGMVAVKRSMRAGNIHPESASTYTVLRSPPPSITVIDPVCHHDKPPSITVTDSNTEDLIQDNSQLQSSTTVEGAHTMKRKDISLSVYEAYPRHVSRGKAIPAIKSALSKTCGCLLLYSVKQYAAAVAGQEQRFIPHCATWMHGERWADSPTELSACKNQDARPVTSASTLDTEARPLY